MIKTTQLAKQLNVMKKSDSHPATCPADSVNLQEITRVWVDGVREYYKDTENLTQVFLRGYFAGMSEREVLGFANQLFDNAKADRSA